MTLTNVVKTKFTGENDTDKAANAVKKNIDGVGKSAKKSESVFGGVGKAIGAAFAVEKLLQFGKESIKLAAQSNPALQKSLDKIGDTFRGFQAQIGGAILGNQDLMDSFTQIVEIVGPVVIKTIQTILNVILLAINGFKTLWQAGKLAFNALTGKDTSEQKKALGELAEESLKIQNNFVSIWTTSQKIKPLADPAKTKADANAKNPLLERLDLLSSLSDLTKLSIKENLEVQGIEAKINTQLKATNLTLEKRIDLLKGLKDTKDILGKQFGFEVGITPNRQAGVQPNAGLGLDRARQQAARNDANRLSDPNTGQPINVFAETLKGSLGPLEGISTEMQDFQATLADLTGNGLVNFSDAFATAFEAIGAGGNVFRSLGQAIKQTIAQTAAFEGRQEFARAAAALAQGILGGTPNAFAAAAKHAAAGALFMGLAGAAGGSGGRGGGGTSGAVADRDRLTRSTSELGKGQVDITITGGFLNMNDPRQAEQFAKAIKDLTGRRVNILSGVA